MPFLLRKIRWNRWAKDFWAENTWLDQDDMPIDPFFDLLKEDKDKDGKLRTELSMWLIEDDKSNLERIIAAMAAHSDNIDTFAYFLIHHDMLDHIKFKIDQEPGETADNVANNSWHYNISQLSCLKLLNLVQIVLNEYRGEGDEENRDKLIIDRKTPMKVKEFIINGLRSGWINRKEINLNEKEIKKIDKLIAEKEKSEQIDTHT